MTNQEHPVWEVYDLQRTARLNAKYYSHKLAGLERFNFWMEIVVAVATPTSAISGIWFFETSLGKLIWSVVISVAAIAAFLKPFLRLSQRIKEYEKALQGYRALELDLEEVGRKVRKDGEYASSTQKMFEAASKKLRVLVANPPELKSDDELVTELYEKVIVELPKESFYVPEK